MPFIFFLLIGTAFSTLCVLNRGKMSLKGAGCGVQCCCNTVTSLEILRVIISAADTAECDQQQNAPANVVSRVST